MHQLTKWEADVVLNDGGIATLRQVRAEDREAMVDFYDRVSPKSKYLRFFNAHPDLSEEELDNWTYSDEKDTVTLVLVERDDIVATARFAVAQQWAPARVADVSFLVQDSHHGRGVGNILLEHLAQIGRECGIERFFAEILTENRPMVQVFVRAGYEIKPELEDGFIVVDFSLDPTHESREVMERRELQAEASSIRRLLSPRTVAVIGEVNSVSRIISSIVTGGFEGQLHALTHDGSARAPELLAEVPGTVDLVVVDHDPDTFDDLVHIAANKKASGILVLAQGNNPFLPPEDAQRFLEHARSMGMRVLGPAALGLINTNPKVRLNASPAKMPKLGTVGVYTQTAGIATLVLSHALRRGCGISNFIASGSYADVTGNDVIQFWAQDESTQVCLLSLDTIGNPRKFFRVLRRLALEKHVVVFLPSRALRSARHYELESLPTAPSSAIDEVIRQAGAIVVNRRDTMYDIATLLSMQPVPRGKRVAIISNSAGLSGQMAQSAVRFGFEPTIIGVEGDPVSGIIEKTTQARQSSDFDLVFSGVVEINDPIGRTVISALDELAARTEGSESGAGSATPMLATLVSIFEDSPLAGAAGSASLTTSSLPVFDTYADALEAYSLILSNEVRRKRVRPHPDDEVAAVDIVKARTLIEGILAQAPQGRTATDEETAALLATCGINLVPWKPVRSFEQAVAAAEEFGWNVVLKFTHPVVRGRPELNAVIRHIADASMMQQAWEALRRLAEILQVDAGSAEDNADQEASRGDGNPESSDPMLALLPVVQRTVDPGATLVVRGIEDAVLGPIVSCGVSGVATDLLHDASWRTPPLRRIDARSMLESLGAAPILHGYKGTAPAHTASLEEVLMRLGRLKDEFPQLSEVELTPVIAGAHSTAVVGARITIAPLDSSRDRLARRL